VPWKFGICDAKKANVANFWDITPCSPYVKRRFRGICCTLFFARLIFDHEDEVDNFALNVGSYMGQTALYARKSHHSKLPLW
jgi:hypothetical protein